MSTKLAVTDNKNKFATLFSAISIAFAITAVIFISYAILLTYTNVSEKHLSLVITATSIISMAVAGFDMAKSSNTKGWLWGMIAGIIYALVLQIISCSVSHSIVLNSKTVFMFLLACASGTFGGIIGINFSKKL